MIADRIARLDLSWRCHTGSRTNTTREMEENSMSMPTYVSPNHLSNEFGTSPTLDDKIEIFRDRVQGWEIDVAKHVEVNPLGGYGILWVLSSYYEMIAQYWKGMSSNRKSKEMFVDGFRLVYDGTPLKDKQIESIYINLRCWLYHNGSTNRDVLISGGFTRAFGVVDINGDKEIRINPHIMLKDIDTHFSNYIQTLRDLTNSANSERRDNFQIFFDAGDAGS
jgi:hypothetical protein